MNTFIDKGKNFTAGEALIKYRRVKKSGANVIYADAGEVAIGVTMDNAANGASIFVKLFNDGGTFPCTAAGAIATNTAIYGANDGKISDTVSGEKLGTTNEASAADLDDIEFIVATPATLLAAVALIADPADPAAITGATPAACVAMTADLVAVDTGTDMTAAQAATIVADFAALKTAVDGNKVAIDANIVDIAAFRTAILANNAAIESLIDAMQASGLVLTA